MGSPIPSSEHAAPLTPLRLMMKLLTLLSILVVSLIMLSSVEGKSVEADCNTGQENGDCKSGEECLFDKDCMHAYDGICVGVQGVWSNRYRIYSIAGACAED